MDNLNKLTEQMGKLTIVTPPSMIKPKDVSFTIVNLDSEQKELFTNQLNEFFLANEVTVYVWDNSRTIDKWLAEAYINSEYVIYGDKDIKQQIKTAKVKHDRRKFNL